MVGRSPAAGAGGSVARVVRVLRAVRGGGTAQGRRAQVGPDPFDVGQAGGPRPGLAGLAPAGRQLARGRPDGELFLVVDDDLVDGRVVLVRGGHVRLSPRPGPGPPPRRTVRGRRPGRGAGRAARAGSGPAPPRRPRGSRAGCRSRSGRPTRARCAGRRPGTTRAARAPSPRRRPVRGPSRTWVALPFEPSGRRRLTRVGGRG